MRHVIEGSLSTGQNDIEAFYEGKKTKVIIRNLEIFRKSVDKLLPGDRGGAFVKLKEKIALKRGGYLLEHDWDRCYKMCSKWKLSINHENNAKNSENTKVEAGKCFIFHSTTSDLSANVISSEKDDIVVQFRHKQIARKNDPVILKDLHGEYHFAHFEDAVEH